jgi:hypothetical protein
MKKLLLPLFIFVMNLLAAQDYQNICNPGTTLYRSAAGEIKAFRRDSVVPAGNSDTTFISYRAMRDDLSFGCLDTTNGSLLGRTILKKANGWFYFFNAGHDSVRINTQAPVNGTWKFADLPEKGYIQAKVTAMANDTVLGVTDMVKTISFQAKDSNDLNVAHVLNQRSIRLSQHHGLSRMLDVYFIPKDTTLYDLAGKTNPPGGLQELSWQQIYDYSAGDEFHYSGGEYHPINGTLWYSYTKSEIYHVLQKTAYGSDSVTYSMEYCRTDTTTYPPSETKVHDTIDVTYRFAQLASANAGWFTKLPGEFINHYNFADDYEENFAYGNRQTKTVRYGAFAMDFIFAGCWIYDPHPDCPAEQVYCHYSNGLGQSHYQQDCYNDIGGHLHSLWNNLVYYRKGIATWGTPVATDCFVLTSTGKIAAPAEHSIEVIPNPAEAEVKISLPGLRQEVELFYSLYNYSGMKVCEGKTDSNPFTLSRHGCRAGFYILVVKNREGALTGIAKINFK